MLRLTLLFQQVLKTINLVSAKRLLLIFIRRCQKEPCLKVSGIDCHIGSQMTSGMPIIEATDKIISLYKKLLAEGIKVNHIDMGGGLGVTL